MKWTEGRLSQSLICPVASSIDNGREAGFVTEEEGAVVRFGLVGSGFRAGAFRRVAAALSDRFSLVGVVTRGEERAREIVEGWGAPAYRSIGELLGAQRPDFVVVSVPRTVAVGRLEELAAAGVPVLCETPPAADLAGLLRVTELARAGARIQVAEQYPYQPLHAARLRLTDTGVLGRVSFASVSFSQDYHACAVMRRHLGITGEPAAVRASVVRAKVESGNTRAGDRRVRELVDDVRTVGLLDFGDRLGVYDFAGNQQRSYVRQPLIHLRGSEGECVHDRVHLVRGLDETVTISLRREEDVGGRHYLRGISGAGEWLWRNPYPEARLADDEVAMAVCLDKMAAYAAGGPAFYGLPEAAQDCYLSYAVHEAAASGEVVRTEVQPWARDMLPPPDGAPAGGISQF